MQPPHRSSTSHRTAKQVAPTPSSANTPVASTENYGAVRPRHRARPPLDEAIVAATSPVPFLARSPITTRGANDRGAPLGEPPPLGRLGRVDDAALLPRRDGPPRIASGRVKARRLVKRAVRTGYSLACSKLGLVPEAWSVTSGGWKRKRRRRRLVRVDDHEAAVQRVLAPVDRGRAQLRDAVAGHHDGEDSGSRRPRALMRLTSSSAPRCQARARFRSVAAITPRRCLCSSS
jgi:hypothetical protein